jgi:hypothetical protein
MPVDNSFLRGFEDEFDDFDFGISAVDMEPVEAAPPAAPVTDDKTASAIAELTAKTDSILATIKRAQSITQTEETRRTEAVIGNDEITASKMKSLEKLILPLLLSLVKPESLAKTYIHWPNRGPVIEKQIRRILAITRGGEE